MHDKLLQSLYSLVAVTDSAPLLLLLLLLWKPNLCLHMASTFKDAPHMLLLLMLLLLLLQQHSCGTIGC
jgi:hypothetical protein